ncbi:hypothetical protein JCM21714_790 [Gracilibacillus boraciitolerans JCM 21714]|uniref:Uncharacterized protein n=1 Tax=Gracilibacillus boraciitolerans JCM 21714 TaxID=1298598 RepID=W4VF77_9BACI|nr:hypothetical protein [Gracilibacillus boraciitolerans]GAE91831.1 hypothetical protein JCM21714_790 [Gracilibacillus boraciitolerans JCM 21714]
MKDYLKTSLVEAVKIEKQYGDFTVHVRIEEISEGFQVLRSIEYAGEEDIVIRHRTPLTQITINADNAVFTGSPVIKQMKPGFQYHPEMPLTFSELKKGEHKVYVHTQFFIEDQKFDIKTKSTIVFK